jgi:hypothetical protein
MATLNFKGYSVEVETFENAAFTTPVVRVTNSNGYWCNAHLANGQVVSFHLENEEDNFKFINSLLKYKGHEKIVYVMDGEFPNSEVVSIDLANSNEPYAANFSNGEKVYFSFFSYEDSIPFRDDVDIQKYQAAITAENALLAAQQAYRDAMNALGALQMECGTYEDYRSWLEIPGIPNREWRDK